jgi:hypothetical protein
MPTIGNSCMHCGEATDFIRFGSEDAEIPEGIKKEIEDRAEKLMSINDTVEDLDNGNNPEVEHDPGKVKYSDTQVTKETYCEEGDEGQELCYSYDIVDITTGYLELGENDKPVSMEYKEETKHSGHGDNYVKYNLSTDEDGCKIYTRYEYYDLDVCDGSSQKQYKEVENGFIPMDCYS